MRLFFPLLLLCTSCHPSEKNKPQHRSVLRHTSNRHPAPLPYGDFKKKVHQYQVSLQDAYRRSDDASRDSIFSKTKSYLIGLIGNSFYDYWKGTPWDFNGMTTKPGEGKIACGYFVTTLLKDAGVPLDRTKLAICPSLTMMKALTSSGNIQNLSSLAYPEFILRMKNYGRNLFVVGLDFHTGFIVNDGSELWFIHSNYINNIGVTKEKAAESPALHSSNTRYITCLTCNKKFLNRWLLH